MTHPFLSIILPAHNEEHRLPKALEEVDAFLKTQPFTSEVIVVENGSVDRTLDVAKSFLTRMPNLRVIHEKGRGKGLAIQQGMLAARGEYRFFADVDLSMPISEVTRFIPPQMQDFDIVIGSREAPGAKRYNEPHYRHLIGRIFNSMVRWMALPGLQDTQCGFKCFRAEIADDIFKVQTFMGMSFDVEVLFIARMRGYRIVEIPVPWYFNADSRVRLLDDSLRMALDIIKIRQNARAGIYSRQ